MTDGMIEEKIVEAAAVVKEEVAVEVEVEVAVAEEAAVEVEEEIKNAICY